MMKINSFLTSLLLLFTALSTSYASELYYPGGEGTLPEKLVVTDAHAVLYKEVGDKGVSIPPLTILWRLTVDGTKDLPIVSSGGKQYYHVGGPDGAHWGYIDINSVTSWMTRFVFVPLPPSSDRMFAVYDQPYSKANFTSLSSKKLESSVLATIKEIPVGFGSFAFILNDEKGNAVQQDNIGIDPNDFKKVMIFNTPISKEGYLKAAEEEAARKGPSPDDIGLDIVFVIDTTASMTPLINMAKNVCKQIASDIHNDQNLSNKVHFGLVNFRDSEYCAYGARVDCDVTADYDQFLSALNSLGELEDSNDAAEDVILGLRAAVDNISWHELSAKHIILVGDSPNKPTPAAGDINTFAKLYNYTNKDHSKNVVDSALKYIRFNAVVGDVREDLRDYAIMEFKEVADNKGDRKGFFALLSDPNLSQNLVKALKDGLFAIINERPSGASTSSSTSAFADSVWDLKEMLKNSQTGASISGDKVTGFACARTNLDSKCADLNIMILREEMKMFHDQLDQAYRRLDKLNSGKGGNVKVIFDTFLEEYVGIASGSATDSDYEMSLATVLKLQMPVKTRTLKMSIREIMRMSSDDRAKWMDGIKDAVDRTQAILDKKEAWTDTFEGASESQRFAFISVADLP